MSTCYAKKELEFERIKSELKSVVGEGFICDMNGNGSIDSFYGNEETFIGFWCCGEDSNEFKDTGMQATNYYAFDIPSISHRYSKCGSVLNEFTDWLDERGMYLEWYDAGTCMIYFNK